MRKIMLTILSGLMILCFTAAVPMQGQGYGESNSADSVSRERDYRDSHRYKSRKYRPRGRGYSHRHSHRYERRIMKEIRRNERRIKKLEWKIRKYYRKRHYRGHYRNRYNSVRIRQYEREIRHLERRNSYLRRLLYR